MNKHTRKYRGVLGTKTLDHVREVNELVASAEHKDLEKACNNVARPSPLHSRCGHTMSRDRQAAISIRAVAREFIATGGRPLYLRRAVLAPCQRA